MTMNATSTENATLISTISGMPRAPAAARIRPFSIDMKPITWVTALRRVHHDEEAKQDHRKCKRHVLARQRIGRRRDLEHHHHGEGDQADAGEHGGTDADDRLDRAVNAEADDDPAQRDRNDHGFDDQRDKRGDEQGRRVLDVALPEHREHQRDRVQSEDIDHPNMRSW